MVSTTKTNKPFNPRGNDQSPKGYNRAALYSGKALDFDGVNDLITTPNISVQSSNVWTYSFYWNLQDASQTGYIFDARTSSVGYALYYYANDNNLDLFQSTGGGNRSVQTFEADQWYHIALSSNGTNVGLYVNGQFVENIAGAIQTYSSTGDLYISSSHVSSVYAEHILSNFKAFDVALTAAQVADLYNNPEKVVPTGVDNTALKLWLPMQEGAGTTAYDGSGNGNHGTISGATYVNGVGAPVSQTAVIDWNKGTNETAYSEEFNSWSTKNDITITDNDATAPDGQETAATITFAASEANARVQNFKAGAFESKTQIVSVWARVTSGTAPFRFKCSHGGVTDYFSNDLTATTEWQRFSFSQTFGSSAGTGVFYGLYNGTDLAARSLEFWGFQLQTDAAALTPYVRTGATAQTSDVLLPQGLTTGRDITGVNLFENVRKQGALNLDGNSWAEVHDNASLDVTTAVTLEAWVKLNETPVNTDSGILSKYSSSSFLFTYREVSGQTGFACYIYGSGGLVSSYATNSQINVGEYYHAVGVYDGGNSITTYLNGVQVSQNTTSIPSSMTTNALDVEIGKWDTNKITNASIAQPRIYNRALTAEEVQRNYNAGKNTYTN